LSPVPYQERFFVTVTKHQESRNWARQPKLRNISLKRQQFASGLANKVSATLNDRCWSDNNWRGPMNARLETSTLSFELLFSLPQHWDSATRAR
jgi:hypothetical protein